MQSTEAINVKDAVQSATAYFHNLMDGVKGITLEEVEMSDDGVRWLVTLSGWIPETRPKLTVPGLASAGSTLADLFSGNHTQILRRFHVDAHTGEVKAMKMVSPP